jgi:hypothetical protein
MKKVENSLTEKLLQIGNPKFWGQNFRILLKGGFFKEGALIRVNWSMRYGKVTGFCLLREGKLETKINLEEVISIEKYEQSDKASGAADAQVEMQSFQITLNKLKKELAPVQVIE